MKITINKNGSAFFFKKTKFNIKIIFYLLFFLIIIFCFYYVGFNISNLGLTLFLSRIKRFFLFKNYISYYPNQSLIFLSFSFLWVSIKTAIIGTFIGFFLSLITAFIFNKNFIKSHFLNKFVTFFIYLLRCLPIILSIHYFTSTYSKEISLILLYFWFSWIWCHKYLNEYILNLDFKNYNLLIYQGNSRFVSFIKSLLPQLKNKIISLFLYSFEANIRWSSILGVLGLIGIGELIFLAKNNRFESMGIPVLILTLFLIFLEFFIYLINKYILSTQTFKKINYTKFTNINLFKKSVILILFFLFIILILYSFFSIDWYSSLVYKNDFLKQIFLPNWKIINEQKDLFLFNDIILLISQTIVIMFISFIFSIFILFISCYKLFKHYAIFGIVFSAILRAFPFFAIFFLINPIFISPISTICLILGFSSGLIIAKNLNESINKIDDKKIYLLRLQSYSKLTIFFKLIFFEIKNEYLNIFLFTWESQFKDLITFGQYSTSTIGIYINTYVNGLNKNINNMAVFIWISFFINIFFTSIFYLYALKSKHNFKFKLFKRVSCEKNICCNKG